MASRSPASRPVGGVDDAHVLLAPAFLRALHEEITAEVGPEAAPTALFQIGFLTGLRDGSRLIRGALAAGAGPDTATAALALRFRANPRPAEPGAVEIAGSWPEEREARAGGGPGCPVSAGYTAGWLSGLYENDVLVAEESCAGRGDPACRFVAREAHAWREGDDPRMAALADAMPFEAFRERLRGEPGPGEATSPDPGAFEPGAPIIHVWGPVMVLPFGGVDEALRAVELIGRDPGASDVSVVVVDLAGAVLDDAFGAAALERILEAVESLGGDVILAGVSSLSEAVVAELERPPLLVAKDIHHGIAQAFQIARAQRRLV